jgi:hypothetical protein
LEKHGSRYLIRRPLAATLPRRLRFGTAPFMSVLFYHRLARPSLTIASLLFVRARGSSQGSSTVTGEAVGEGEGEGTVRCGPSIHSARCCLQRPAPRGQSKTPDHIFPDPAELKASSRLFQSSLSCTILSWAGRTLCTPLSWAGRTLCCRLNAHFGAFI